MVYAVKNGFKFFFIGKRRACAEDAVGKGICAAILLGLAGNGYGQIDRSCADGRFFADPVGGIAVKDGMGDAYASVSENDAGLLLASVVGKFITIERGIVRADALADDISVRKSGIFLVQVCGARVVERGIGRKRALRELVEFSAVDRRSLIDERTFVIKCARGFQRATIFHVSPIIYLRAAEKRARICHRTRKVSRARRRHRTADLQIARMRPGRIFLDGERSVDRPIPARFHGRSAQDKFLPVGKAQVRRQHRGIAEYFTVIQVTDRVEQRSFVANDTLGLLDRKREDPFSYERLGEGERGDCHGSGTYVDVVLINDVAVVRRKQRFSHADDDGRRDGNAFIDRGGAGERNVALFQRISALKAFEGSADKVQTYRR